MSLTLEQYLALSVFDYDKIESGYKTSELAYVAKSDIPYPSQVCLTYQSSGKVLHSNPKVDTRLDTYYAS